jgi:hypothetical protein
MGKSMIELVIYSCALPTNSWHTNTMIQVDPSQPLPPLLLRYSFPIHCFHSNLLHPPLLPGALRFLGNFPNTSRRPSSPRGRPPISFEVSPGRIPHRDEPEVCGVPHDLLFTLRYYCIQELGTAVVREPIETPRLGSSSACSILRSWV